MANAVPYGEWPADRRARELLIEHSFGRDVMKSARDYAWERIPANASQEARECARNAVLDAIYGFFMLLDGVTGQGIDASHGIRYVLAGQVVRHDKPRPSDVLEEYEIAPDGDGLCMGFHSWVEGDFGDLQR